MYNEDNANRLPTADMLGYSSYRMAADPLSLCAYFQNYVPTNNAVWLCPAGRSSLKDNGYGVNYAWSRAQTVTGNNSSTAFNNMMNTVVLWDNFTFALPSTPGVPEPASTGGPSAVASYLRYYPHDSKKKANYLYLDGRTYSQ
jgi:prepilin-type processing-associated H-X9-DG protein